VPKTKTPEKKKPISSTVRKRKGKRNCTKSEEVRGRKKGQQTAKSRQKENNEPENKR